VPALDARKQGRLDPGFQPGRVHVRGRRGRVHQDGGRPDQARHPDRQNEEVSDDARHQAAASGHHASAPGEPRHDKGSYKHLWTP